MSVIHYPADFANEIEVCTDKKLDKYCTFIMMAVIRMTASIMNSHSND
jgi:hypothetical protein